MRQKNFKIVSLLTVFTIVLNVLSAVVLLRPAYAAITVVELSTMVASSTGVTFTVTGDGTLTMPASFTNVTSGTNCTATLQVVVCTASGDFTADLPATIGSYNLGPVSVIVVDSDTVDVTGYINTSLTFDLDTGSTIADVEGTDQMTDDCAFDACLGHADEAAPPGNYTVDLGNLLSGVENVSGDLALHADGVPDSAISYIGFDLSSNAAAGTVVTMVSLYGALSRTGTVDAWDIPSSHADGSAVLTDGFTFTGLGTGHGYGWRYYSDPSYINAGEDLNATDLLLPQTDCQAADTDQFCTAKTGTGDIILSTGDSVEGLRATLMIGAMANGTNPAGTYEDTLTFIATGTF